MFSPPSARGWRRLKIRSDANFSYGYSKGVRNSGEQFCGFFGKSSSHVWGAGAQPSLHRAYGYLVIGHNMTACEQSLAGLRLFGENVSNI